MNKITNGPPKESSEKLEPSAQVTCGINSFQSNHSGDLKNERLLDKMLNLFERILQSFLPGNQELTLDLKLSLSDLKLSFKYRSW